MASSKSVELESARSMRPVAVVFFSAISAVTVLLMATASFAISPLGEAAIEFAAR